MTTGLRIAFLRQQNESVEMQLSTHDVVKRLSADRSGQVKHGREQGHLKDRGFASPIVDEAEAAAKAKKEAMDREIEIVKKEYEEKLKKKKKATQEEEKKKSEKGKEGDKAKADEKKSEDEAAEAEHEQDEKIKAITSKHSPPAVIDDTPRIYALQKIFFQKRLDRIRNAEIAKRNRERLKSPNLFPSVPTGNPG
ncbi:MAG: hypothetical protein Q9195_004057 [Heterodermia aff. obscurata]